MGVMQRHLVGRVQSVIVPSQGHKYPALQRHFIPKLDLPLEPESTHLELVLIVGQFPWAVCS